MGETLHIVIPAYNERDNIREVVEGWHAVAEWVGGDSRLVVVNDGSRDDTLGVLRSLEASHPRLVVLDKENGGHGPAVTFGYRWALDHGADWVFQTDSDGQTLPSEFRAFWDDRAGHDMLIGLRDTREDGLSRVVVTRALRLVVRLAFGVRVPDANTPFRLMTAESLRENLRWVPGGFNLPNVVLSVAYVRFGWRAEWRHVTFRPRQGGVNSINLPRIARIGWRALGDFRRIARDMRAAS